MHPQRQHLNATPTAPRASSGALGAGALGAGALCTVGGVLAAVGGPETIEDTVTQ